MSARIEQAVAKRAVAVTDESSKKKVNIVGFDAKLLRAPFVLRCGALIIDYLLFIAAPVVAMLSVRSSGLSGLKLLSNQTNTIGWLIAILLAVTNFVILPIALGQTVGKLLTGLQVVQKDGNNLTFSEAAIRHLIGYPLTLLTGGLGFLLAAFTPSGKALHDYIAGTVVVQGRRRKQ